MEHHSMYDSTTSQHKNYTISEVKAARAKLYEVVGFQKSMATIEKQRLESSHSTALDVYIDVSVLNEDTSSWNRGENTILRYSLDRNELGIKIEGNMDYLTLFNGGGPIAPLDYISTAGCPFRWDFPILDFKILNNTQAPLYLTEVVLDIEQSHANPAPLLTIKKDTHRRNAGYLLLVNESSCELINLIVSFDLLAGKVEKPADFVPPFRYSIPLQTLNDNAKVDVMFAFRDAGVDIDSLILLSSATLDQNNYIVRKADGSEEWMTEAEFEEQYRKGLGPFQDEVGTLVGKISFTTLSSEDHIRQVYFHAPVYLANENRAGIPKPPTFAYDSVLDVQNTDYQRRIQISQLLPPGETDRFTLKVAVAQSSSHRFRATLYDITGLALQSLPIEMNCFVPGSRKKRLEAVIASKSSNLSVEK
jgi:hypothetical protein